MQQAFITLTVSAGWQNHYRSRSTWVPVHAAVRNLSAAPFIGTLEIPDNTLSDQLQTRRELRVLYSTAVSVAAGGSTLRVLYLPASDIRNQVTVLLRSNHETVATDTVFPVSWSERDITVGVLARDPATVSWTTSLTMGGKRTAVTPLSVAAFDSYPEALASFDILILSNLDSSQFDLRQRAAMERYVRNGGSLVLVGGPDWLETLGPLPAAVVPGQLTGSRTSTRAIGLTGKDPSPPGNVVLSVLARPKGIVRATDGTLPLVVSLPVGTGLVLYLAFDPGLAPFSGWPGEPAMLDRLLSHAAANAFRRLALPADFGSSTFLQPPLGTVDIEKELANVPSLKLQTMGHFIALALGSIIIVGILPVLFVRRKRRLELAWIAVPLLGIVTAGGVLGISSQSRTVAVPVSTIGMVEMDGAGPHYPETLYMGMTAPHAGSYGVTFDAPTLARPVISPLSLGYEAEGTRPVLWNVDQGPQTVLGFSSVGATEIRTMELRLSAFLPGVIQLNLHLNHAGDIVGFAHDATVLTLLHPAVIAGRAWVVLPDMHPGQTVPIHLHPDNSVGDREIGPVLPHVYGQSLSGGSRLLEESNLSARIRNAVSMLPETNIVSMLGQVVFTAWTTNPLSTVSTANGDVRALTLLVRTASVAMPSEPFRLPTGVVGASLVDSTPSVPKYACCGPSPQAIFIGTGGSDVFAFDLSTPVTVRFRKLILSAYAGGADPSVTGYNGMPSHAVHVYNWRHGVWTDVEFKGNRAVLPSPGEIISPTGSLLVKLSVSRDTQELTIADLHQDLQLSGVAA